MKFSKLLITNVALILFAYLFNRMVGNYANTQPFDGYPKMPTPPDLMMSLKTFVHDPLFVIKFYLLANTGNLIGYESYQTSAVAKNLMPFVGAMVLAAYGYCVYIFVKYKKLEYLNAISLIFFVVVFYALITLSRISFNDLYYGTSSRYTGATFSGMLGLATILLSLMYTVSNTRKRALYISAIGVICMCYAITNVKQWWLAPYRKFYFQQMAQHFKENENLESLQGFNAEIAAQARKVMIENELNVFKPQTKLQNYTLTPDLDQVTDSGFYNLEHSATSKWRWTNGKGEIMLPNLYTNKDSVKVRLFCYAPLADTPVVILNDNLHPSTLQKFNGGFEYHFPVYRQRIFFKASILNKSYVPKMMDSTNTDKRMLGLVFGSMTFND